MSGAELVRWADRAFSPGGESPGVAFAAAAAAVALLPLSGVVPMTLLCLAVAARLPPLPAAAAILGGAAANTVLAWTAARSALGPKARAWLDRRGGWTAAVAQGARREPLKWAFLARYVPAPFVAAPVVLATAGVGLGTTLAGTLLGMAPWTAVYLYAAGAGREETAKGFGRAALALLAAYVVVRLLRSRLRPREPQAAPLRPRKPGTPVVRLYTLPGQDLSDEARDELAGLRDELGFEVEETALPAAGGGEGAAYADHAPVALLDGERLFSYKVDANALRARFGRKDRARGNP